MSEASDILCILSHAASAHGCSSSDITGDRRQRHVVTARAIAASAMRHQLGMTLERIGEILGGRHHTTILNLLRRKSRKRDK